MTAVASRSSSVVEGESRNKIAVNDRRVSSVVEERLGLRGHANQKIWLISLCRS